MSQNDLVIINQSFPSFRTDLNSALQAINSSHSGSSIPSGAVAGTIWLDTTSATSPTLKFYDGTDSISLAIIDYTNNTVNWLDSSISYNTTATSAGTLTLTVSSSYKQYLTGTTTHTVVLPVTSTLTLGQTFEIHNNSTGSITVNSSGSNLVGTVQANTSAECTCILTSGTTAASWDFDIIGFSSVVPTTRGGTGLTAIGTSLQVLRVNSGATALEFATAGGSATPFAVTGDATSGSEIRLPEDTDNGANYIALKAADSIASNLTLTLPSADGTSGQVLQTNGSGVLSFSSPSSDFVKLATTTISSSTATITIDGYMSATYKHYKFVVSDLEPVGGSYYYLYMRYIIANVEATASNYITSCGGGNVDSAGSPSSYDFGNFNGNKFEIGTNIGSTNGYGWNFEFTIPEAQSTDRYKAFVGINTQRNDDFSRYYVHSCGGVYTANQSALTGISFSATANFDKGTITMYGIK